MNGEQIDHDPKGRPAPTKIVEADGRLQAIEMQMKMPAIPPIARGRPPLFRDRMAKADKRLP